jgi:hypothetical protein
MSSATFEFAHKTFKSGFVLSANVMERRRGARRRVVVKDSPPDGANQSDQIVIDCRDDKVRFIFC